jgi:hypothetical protein
MMPPPVLGLVGHPGAGKDTLARWLAEDFGYTVVSAIAPVRTLVATLYPDVPKPRRVLQAVAQALRAEDPAVFARLLEATVHHPGRWLVPDLRDPAEADVIQRVGGLTIGVVAPPAAAARRLRARDGARWAEGLDAPTERLIPTLLARCPLMVSNAGTLADFRAAYVATLQRR